MVKRATCAALLAAAAAAPTAGAEEVILVDGKHAEREHDPLAPRRSGTDLPPPGRSSAVGLAVLGRSSAAGRRAVGRVLGAALREDRISRARYRRYRRGFRRGVAVWRRLRGLRRRELGYPLWSLERIALRGRLTRTRMPALFLQLRRNT